MIVLGVECISGDDEFGLSRYSDPTTMIAGAVRAPYVPLGNDRIDRRHAHSIALSAFFRYSRQTSGETWSAAGDFFLGEDPPASRVRSFLSPVPPDVLESLRRVLPEDVQRQIRVGTDDWVATLADLLEEIRLHLRQDVDVFEERRRQAYQDRKGDLVSRYEKTVNTLTRRNLLGYLANHNVLPKYGFPVDTVELRTAYSSSPVGSKLDLSRDLSARTTPRSRRVPAPSSGTTTPTARAGRSTATARSPATASRSSRTRTSGSTG